MGIRVYPLLIVTLISISCKEEIVSPQAITTIVVNPTDQFLPTKVGNSWNYIDSLYQDNKLTVTNHKTSITSEEIINNKTWYRIEDLDIGLMSFGIFFWSNNKIYSRFVTWTPNVYSEGVKIIPAVEFGTNYGMMISSDTGGIFVYAIHHKKKYVIKNYIFTEYFEYIFSGGLELYRVIIVPGVGVVDYFVIGQDYPGRKGYTNRSSLEYFSLK